MLTMFNDPQTSLTSALMTLQSGQGTMRRSLSLSPPTSANTSASTSHNTSNNSNGTASSNNNHNENEHESGEEHLRPNMSFGMLPNMAGGAGLGSAHLSSLGGLYQPQTTFNPHVHPAIAYNMLPQPPWMDANTLQATLAFVAGQLPMMPNTLFQQYLAALSQTPPYQMRNSSPMSVQSPHPSPSADARLPNSVSKQERRASPPSDAGSPKGSLAGDKPLRKFRKMDNRNRSRNGSSTAPTTPPTLKVTMISPPSSNASPNSNSTHEANRDMGAQAASVSNGSSGAAKTDKQYKCAICHRTFGYKHVLQNHERTHTGEKPFECLVCQKRFTRDHHLKTHMRLHTGEKPYHCQYCSRDFVQVANLRRHMRVHTGDKPYNCEICKSNFSDSNQLKTHRQTHADEHPFQCESGCQMRFRRRQQLAQHKCPASSQQHSPALPAAAAISPSLLTNSSSRRGDNCSENSLASTSETGSVVDESVEEPLQWAPTIVKVEPSTTPELLEPEQLEPEDLCTRPRERST